MTNGCIMPVEKAIIWHRRRLRLSDHAAVAYATENYDTVMPLFVFDPAFYGEDGLACDSRIAFLHDSLQSLEQLYTAVGGDLIYRHGDPVELLQRLSKQGWEVIATADPTARHGYQRDQKLSDKGIVNFVSGDGLVRSDGWSRRNWEAEVEEWFTAEQRKPNINDINFEQLDEQVSVDEIEEKYAITPQKTNRPVGGRQAAVETLQSFARQIRSYPKNISAPSDARTGTSQLSPYLRFGCLSLREVYQYVMEHCPDCTGRDMFISRLFWNRHYLQKLVDWPGWTERAANPVMEDLRSENYNSEYVRAWKYGETGYPMVDASMRCLRETGWLNFRMRAMCVSFFTDILQQPWKIGADYFHYHLIDSDPGINYTQWQYQAGTVGTDLMRIYNPIKQVEDNDPEGEFIKQYIPELQDFPVGYLERPERAPEQTQQEANCIIGKDYPEPVVEFAQARERAHQLYEQLKVPARQALHTESIARRASLARLDTPPSELPDGDPPSTPVETIPELDEVSLHTDDQSTLEQF